MQHQIDGVIAQVLHLRFEAGESCWASRGSIVSLEDGLDWHLKVPGGFEGAVKRGLAGENLALTFIQARREGAQAVLSANQAGKITAWDLEEDGPVLATRGSFLAAVGEVDIGVSIARRAGAAFFGGAGFFLQKMSGRGQIFIHGAGDFMERVLGEGERMLVSNGNLAAFSQQVDYNVRSVGGCRKMLFGGEGIFMTELVGPGRVLLQSLKRTLVQATAQA